LNIIWLEFEGKKNKKLNWTYINFLQMDNVILVPKLNIDEDEQALVQIQKHFKIFVDTKRVVQVEIRDLVETGGGALNCISWTIKV
jgi:agmatine/peptidylarginine deiminase